MPALSLLCGDALAMLKTLPAESVHCCVTSPPYYGLRMYLRDGDPGKEHELGLEPTLDEYLARLVAVFGEVRRVLRSDGVCFVNIGDSYAGSGKGGNPGDSEHIKQSTNAGSLSVRDVRRDDLAPKQRLLVPFRLALLLQADGWWVRDVICWAKRAPMPESVTDRCTQAWEPILMLTKSARYFWDAEAVKEQTSPEAWHNSDFRRERNREIHPNIGKDERDARSESRNPRNFWLLGPEPYPDAHFATFPTEIPKRCIMAASPVGGTVLDPFAGSGTTLAVALELGRSAIGIELSPEYVKLAERRCAAVTPGLALA